MFQIVFGWSVSSSFILNHSKSGLPSTNRSINQSIHQSLKFENPAIILWHRMAIVGLTLLILRKVKTFKTNQLPKILLLHINSLKYGSNPTEGLEMCIISVCQLCVSNVSAKHQTFLFRSETWLMNFNKLWTYLTPGSSYP